MLTPGSLDACAFGRALAAAAGHRDPERAADVEHAHDDESDGLSCRSDLFVQLAAAMVGGSDTVPKDTLIKSPIVIPANAGIHEIQQHGPPRSRG